MADTCGEGSRVREGGEQVKAAAVIALLVCTGCAVKKSAPASLVIPPGCQRKLELKACTPEPNNPDWCDGKYRMHFVCTQVKK